MLSCINGCKKEEKVDKCSILEQLGVGDGGGPAITYSQRGRKSQEKPAPGKPEEVKAKEGAASPLNSAGC